MLVNCSLASENHWTVYMRATPPYLCSARPSRTLIAVVSETSTVELGRERHAWARWRKIEFSPLRGVMLELWR